MTIDIYMYTHICACMCMYVYVLLCMVAFQPPSSLLPASLQHPFPSSLLPASFQPPPSLLPASFQPPSSIFSDTQVHWSSICFCTYVHWQSILFDINIYVHSPSIFFDNIYALVINLYGWFVTHTCTVFFVLLAQNSCWCTVSWHQGCLPSVHCTTHAHYAIWQTCICWTAYT